MGPLNTDKLQLTGLVRVMTMALAIILAAGCSGPALKKEVVREEASFALAPATEGALWAVANNVLLEHGPEHSGFRLLDKSYDSLVARLVLMDSAVSSIDIQTYLWYPDNSGRLILERAIEAADRGVKVRLIVDDLLTIGLDQVIYQLNQNPNIEFRLFNPWKNRSMLSRGGEMVAEMERLNQRMHDKLIIADGNAVVVGGRNIGDHYFGLSYDYNFHDLDLLGFGHIARQANGMFDSFWNSEWVVSAINLNAEPDPEFARQKWSELQERNRAAPELQVFGTEPADWREVLAAVADELHPGTSLLVTTKPGGMSSSRTWQGRCFRSWPKPGRNC